MSKLLTLLFLIAVSYSGFSQSATITGKVSDTLEKKSLSNAVIVLISKTDSSVYKFTRSHENGEFIFHGVAFGNYKLLITFPKFADYADEVMVKDSGMVNLGAVAL